MPEQNLCVEIDGTPHFYARTRHELCTTRLKYRQMDHAKLNYLRLVHLDYFRPGRALETDSILSAIEKATK